MKTKGKRADVAPVLQSGEQFPLNRGRYTAVPLSRFEQMAIGVEMLPRSLGGLGGSFRCRRAVEINAKG